MTNKNGQQPMILLISREEREEFLFKQWLEEREPNVCEANDIFQVIEEISDFTVRECPEVILLEVERASQDSVEAMFHVSSGASEIQIVAYSKSFGRRSALSLGA